MRTLSRLVVVPACAAALALAAGGCGDDDAGGGTTAQNGAPTATAPATTSPSEPSVTVYFSDESGRLVAEEREGPASLERALAELAEGPESADLTPALPAGTRVLGAVVEGGVAGVDLSAEFESGYPSGGAAAELAIVGAIVHTATALPGIEAVAITVEGRRPEPLGSQLDFSQTLSPADVPLELAP